MFIAIDFDGTCVEYKFPAVGPDVPGAVEALKLMTRKGHKLILWTVRNKEYLEDACEWFKERGISLYAVNENPSQEYWMSDPGPKIFAHIYIDDMAVGCPLSLNPEGRDYVNWSEVMRMLKL